MKLHPGPPNVLYNEKIIEALSEVFDRPTKTRPGIIIETGTYKGLGSTQLVIEAVKRSKYWGKKAMEKLRFYTMEASEALWREAKTNLKSHRFWVECLHGTSVDVEEAIIFIENDDLLKEHAKYQDIYYDSPDPVKFYIDEIKGANSVLGVGKRGGNDLLKKYLVKARSKKPLLILDSAGGVGFFEYTSVLKIMGDKPFYVWVHDINHVKHIRSYHHMLNDDDVTILDQEEGEWALAQYNM